MKTTMKKVTSAAALACFMTIGIQSVSAQVGMSGNNPDKSAALDLNATNKGLLVPRVNLASLTDKASINGGNPAVSLMVYNTNATLGAGFYYWSGTAWVKMAIKGEGDNLGNHTATQALIMGDNSVNFSDNTDAYKVKYANSTTGPRVDLNAGYIVKNVAGLSGNSAGGHVWANYNGSTETELMRLNANGLNVVNKVTTPAAQISTGAGTGKIAVSDASGNVVWTDPANVTTKGDNLGNHTATQALTMQENAINFSDNTDAYKIKFLNSTSGARIDMNTGYLMRTVTGLSGKGDGQFAWFNYNGTTETERMRLNSTALTLTNKLVTPAAQISTGAGNGKIAVSDASGNVVWTDPATIASKGDNLGDHSATKDITMNNNSVTGAYKLTGKYVQATEGAGVNKVAVSDKDGNIIWTDPANVTTKGDNLGNHTATQALTMQENAINFSDNTDAFKIKFLNSTSGARIDMNTGYVMRTVTGLSGKGDGQFAWYNYNGTTETERMRLNSTALTLANKLVTPAAQISNGAGNGKIAVSDASGNVVWTDPATIATKGTATQVKAGGAIDGNAITVTGDGVSTPYTISGDNLGNHKATTTLDMAKNDINNINNAYVKNDLHLVDHTASNTKDFILYKSDGKLGIYNSLKGGNDIEINEATRTTTVNNLAITNSAQGSGPAAGSIATSVDDKGNVAWKPASDIAKGTITGKNVIAVSNGANNSFKDTDISIKSGTENQVLQTLNGTPTWGNMAGSWVGLLTGGTASQKTSVAVPIQFTDSAIIGGGGKIENNSITVPVTGLYEIVVNGHTMGEGQPYLTTWEIKQNGTTVWSPHYGSPNRSWGTNAGATSYLRLNANDVITLSLSCKFDYSQKTTADTVSFCVKLMQ